MRQSEQPGGRCRAVMALAVAGVLAWAPAGRAEAPEDPDRPTYNLFGMTGTIDTPSAEMQPDGQISVTSGYFGGFLRNTFSAQIFPGVEAAFRYSVLRDFFDTGEGTLYDRSFDFKLRLVTETEKRPALAVGLQDFLGTGVYSAEYLVATKSFLDGDLTLSGGVGWGRFAGDNGVYNPFRQISDRFDSRGGGSDTGGTVNFGNYFSGPEMGFFGGIEWQTPLDGLTLKAEYSDDQYFRERRNSDFDVKIPFNFGAEYRYDDWLTLGGYYNYGTEFGFRVTISGNVLRAPAAGDNEPAPIPFRERPPAPTPGLDATLGAVTEMLDGASPSISITDAPVTSVTVEPRLGNLRWATATMPPSADYVCPTEAAPAIDAEYGMIDAVSFIHADGTAVCTVALRPDGANAIRLAERQGGDYPTDWHADEATRQAAIERLAAILAEDDIDLFAAELEPTRVTAYIENGRYRAMPRAIGRTVRALSETMPPSVEIFEVVPVESSMPVVAVIMERGILERQIYRGEAPRNAFVAAEIRDPEPFRRTDPTVLEEFPRYSWAIEPSIPVNFFDPDQPARFDLQAVASGGIEFLPGLSVNGEIRKRVVGQLDDITRENDSELPRVRSDFAEYLREGDPGITRLTGDYVTKLDDDVYGRVSVGLLEMMFGGVSAEVLWKPAEQSWGLGAEVNYARQRDFDTLFTFRDYDIVTGHASLYWDTPVYGVSAQLDAGRYLAGDYGATITLKRRFANGWEIGGFATFTDVPFDEFGEGSFDKGIFLTIPLNWVTPYETRSELNAVIRPLTRDGGQRLNVANRLYPIVEDQDRGGLRTNWGSFWK